MIPHYVYYQLAIVGLLWLCIMLHSIWPSRDAVLPQLRTEPMPLRFKRKRANEPKPFAGLTQRPHCAACEHDANHPQVPPPQRPEPMPPTSRRPCEIDTSMHFCPHAGCDYRGWLGLGNLRTNGHPSGGPWRQFHCTACKGNCSGSENLPLAIQSPHGIPCRHGNTTGITTRGVGTDPIRSASLYSGAGSTCGDHGIHSSSLTGAGPHVTGTAAPNLPEFLTPTFERSATAQTATSPSESSTSRRTTGSPWPYAHPDPCGRSR